MFYVLGFIPASPAVACWQPSTYWGISISVCLSLNQKKNAISQEALGPFVWVELFLREHIRSCAGDATRKPFHFVRCWVSSRFSGLLSPPLRASLFAPQATVLCLGLSRHPGKALAGLAHHTRAEQYLCVSAL